MRKLFLLLIASSIISLCSSCGNDDPTVKNDPIVKDEEIPEVSVKGNLEISDQIVHEGMGVMFKLTQIEGLERLYQYNPSYKCSVEYYVDNSKVGESAVSTNDYQYVYTVRNLSVGQHSIKAVFREVDGLKIISDIKTTTFTVREVVANAVDVSLSSKLTISKDLFDFVTPVVTYTDAYGEHQEEITAEMCTDDVSEHDGITIENKVCEYKIPAYIAVGETNIVILSYKPKEMVADVDRRYYLNSSFGIKSYSYSFHGIHTGFITNLNINITVGTGIEKTEDGRIAGSDVAEYLRQLCATPKTYCVVLGEDADLKITE